ncbi:kinase-like domain-containing protein [Rhexocercosporidium sp. MPI-PUGE-AT-0058]|nr:kinase-like domain-containing protein [Rhexocercosporidium sp. MPI-PUGE-AT-0058]
MWTHIATKINDRASLRRAQKIDTSYFIQTIFNISLAIWSKFPDFIRFQTYRFLRTTGAYLYGSTKTGVQRLPFGMYLKHGPQYHVKRHAGEFNALKLYLLVISRLEGEPAGLALDKCSDEEMYQIGQDLRSWIAELHAITIDRDPKYAITNASGGPCLDYRIGGDPVGPFPSENEFSESLRLGILPDLVHRTDHQIVFTHADLNLRNILVKDGKLSGIVDWENAGFFSEYWEYTKCYFGTSLAKRWLKVVDTVFENRYKAELEIERQYWAYHSL